jgi:cytochrome oxidase Cu insertion factor (SCO1/SenC/PrrC family)
MTEPRNRLKGRRTLLLLALVVASPIVASYMTYYWFVPDKRVNYGELLTPGPAPPVVGLRPDGTPFALADLHGQWVMLIVTGADCTDACRRALYATRQARTMQGREQDRVVRAWLRPLGAAAPSAELRESQPGLVIGSAAQAELSRLPLDPSGAPTILLLDPRGNLVLRYGAESDIKRLAADLGRLLRASQIG